MDEFFQVPGLGLRAPTFAMPLRGSTYSRGKTGTARSLGISPNPYPHKLNPSPLISNLEQLSGNCPKEIQEPPILILSTINAFITPSSIYFSLCPLLSVDKVFKSISTNLCCGLTCRRMDSAWSISPRLRARSALPMLTLEIETKNPKTSIVSH